MFVATPARRRHLLSLHCVGATLTVTAPVLALCGGGADALAALSGVRALRVHSCGQGGAAPLKTLLRGVARMAALEDLEVHSGEKCGTRDPSGAAALAGTLEHLQALTRLQWTHADGAMVHQVRQPFLISVPRDNNAHQL